MTGIEIRPNFRTSGGELNDIMVNGAFAGVMTLIYREGDRLTGSVQLEEDSLAPSEKDRVVSSLRSHIQSVIYAVDAETCDVILTYGRYDEIITAHSAEDADLNVASDEMWAYDDEAELDDEETMDEHWASLDYELVIVDETRNRITYHVYDDDGNWIAEAGLRMDRADITGDIRWVVEPDEDEIEFVTELLVSDFDEDEAETFRLDHIYEGELVESIELTHEGLLEDEDVEAEPERLQDGDYKIMLARDDGDTLTYEIYSEKQGGLPIGTATVDIQQRRLTGFIDFRSSSDAEDAVEIAAQLMRELDKEKEYDGLNLSLMHKNRLIDEIVFENETVH